MDLLKVLELHHQTPDPMEQPVKALEKLTPVSTLTTLKAPSFDSDREAELFISQFKDVDEANKCTEPDTPLHLRGYLERKTRVYGCGASDRDS